jgi:hypothetical protein
VSPKYHLDEFGDGEPGQDSGGSAAEVIVMLGGDCFASLAMTMGRPGTEDLEESDEEGVELLAGAE